MPPETPDAGLGRHRRALLMALVAVALIARLAGSALLGMNAPPVADDRDYDKLALSLSRGEGYAIEGYFISFRPPLYPVFLSLVYRVAGQSYPAVRVAQALLGAFSAWLAFLIGRRLFGERRAFIAAALFAVAPADVFFCHGLLTETLFIPLLGAMVYALVRASEARVRGASGVRWLLAGGVALGSATLTRPVLLLFPPFLLMWVLWTYRRSDGRPDLRAAAGGFSVIIAVALIVTAPWIGLVHKHTGHWVPVTTGGGVTFWGGNNVRVLEGDRWGRWVFIGELPFYDELRVVAYDQVEVDRRAWRLGFNFLANNPDKVPKLLMYKLARFWNPWANLPWGQKSVYLLTYGLALPWMLAGMVMTFRRDRPEVILHLLVGTFCLSALVFWGDARIRSAVSPYLWMFAVVAAARAWRRMAARRASPA
ncbi:MAG: glycosyltransferase family 39 protein [Deltaproteobacteria bacterium]|nr:glycosyltransferase family 39 protein [Deltaproteobacteria bacterium]